MSVSEMLRREVRSETEMLSYIYHELAQPLTELHGTLELALRRDDAGLRGAVTQSLAAAERAINSLCYIRQLADAAEPGLLEQIGLFGTACEIFDEFRPVAEQKLIALEVVGGPELWIAANRARLSEALTRIMDSTLAASPTLVCLRSGADGVRLTVTGANLNTWTDVQSHSLALARAQLNAVHCKVEFGPSHISITPAVVTK